MSSTKIKRLGKLAIPFIAILLAAFVIGVWTAGSLLVAPVRHSVGDPPGDLGARTVQFASQSGATIHGWFIPGKKNAGAIILMHGVRANRLSMLDRARFLSKAGFSVLLFDFQGHGESSGEHITFGYLESRDARAAVDFLRNNAPGEKIAVIGVSMGGAATLLASPPLEVDAMVLEMVYPTINDAVDNRLKMRFGALGAVLTPLFICQLRPRLGFGADALRPIEKVGEITTPKLFIVGAQDQHTTLRESEEMFNAAAEPKELWIIEDAQHADLYERQKQEYEQRVLRFFESRLRESSP